MNKFAGLDNIPECTTSGFNKFYCICFLKYVIKNKDSTNTLNQIGFLRKDRIIEEIQCKIKKNVSSTKLTHVCYKHTYKSASFFAISTFS